MDYEIMKLEQQISKTLLESDDYKTGAFEWRISAIGKCQRLMEFELKHGCKPFNVQSIHRMERGQYLHDMWQTLMKDSFGDDFVHAEAECLMTVNGPGTIVGHVDGFFESLDAVYELKTVADSTFTLVVNKDAPLPAHYEQANAYAHCFAAKNILFHYYNVNSGESKYILLPVNPQQYHDSVKKFESAYMNNLGGTLCDRPCVDPSKSPCWFCPYKEECYEGWEGEVKSMGAAEITDEVFVLNVKACNTARDSRLECAKSEENLKEMLSKDMVKREIKDAVIDGYRINLKLGSKGNPLITIKKAKGE